MHRSGYSLHEIAQVTHHKNIESLKHYLEQPTLEDMQNYSASLFDYSCKQNKENTNNSDDEAFETPPKPTRNVYETEQTKKKNKNMQECDPTNQMVPYTQSSEIVSSQSNIMQSYRQNPIGMFFGANLNNCTININMPK